MNKAELDRRRDLYLQKLESIIERVGWAVVVVAPTVEDPPEEIPFGYTVGLHDKGFPELFMAGLPPQVMYECINLAARVVLEDGMPQDGQFSDRIFNGFNACFRTLPAEAVAKFGLQAEGHAKGPVDGVQVVYPDQKGLYPWEAGCAESIKSGQDFLFEHAAPGRTLRPS